MELNKLPIYDQSDNPTNCCPKFDPKGWDEQELHFKNKPFVRVTSRSIFHIPINMGQVFAKTFEALEHADAIDEDQFVVLSSDLSSTKSEHLFAVTKEVAGQKIVYLSGEYLTRVFEGPYKEAPKWYSEIIEHVEQLDKKPKEIYFFYTTCPRCAKYYGKNYVIGIARAA